MHTVNFHHRSHHATDHMLVNVLRTETMWPDLTYLNASVPVLGLDCKHITPLSIYPSRLFRHVGEYIAGQQRVPAHGTTSNPTWLRFSQQLVGIVESPKKTQQVRQTVLPAV